MTRIPLIGTRNARLFRLPAQIYAAYWYEQEDLAHAIELVGENKVMFETDFPHPTCLYPDVKERIEAGLGPLDPRVQRKVLCENAAGVYGIDLPS